MPCISGLEPGCKLRLRSRGVTLRVRSHCGQQGVVVINLFNGPSISVITLQIKLFLPLWFSIIIINHKFDDNS